MLPDSLIAMTRKPVAHKWSFPSRIRPNAFSWRSSATAITRIREAVSEIRTVARSDAATAAEGAIRLIERISPALEHVDGSSGALGSAVNGAIGALIPLIGAADVPDSVRQKWLERLYEAHAADQVPYIEILADYWGELCATSEIASAWADRLIDVTRMALGPDKALRGHFHGTTACLSALLHAGRFKDIYSLLAHTDFWHRKCFAGRGPLIKRLTASVSSDEGKLFTAAKELGMYDLALELVRNSPCDPKTLSRAAGTHAERHPEFAVGAGRQAHKNGRIWLVVVSVR